MAQSLIACPLCSAASFSSTNALCLSLINVASKWLRCTLCEEELRGIDKLTIHLLGHLMNNTEFKRNLGSNNSGVLEPLNLVKPQNEHSQENVDQEMVLDKNSSNMFNPKGLTEDLGERFSLKVDDEVMIFFNSNDKNKQTSEDKNSLTSKCGVEESLEDKSNELMLTTGPPRFNFDFAKSVSDIQESETNSIALSSDVTSHTNVTNPTSHFIFTPDQRPSNNCVVPQVELPSTNNGENENIRCLANVYSANKNHEEHYSNFIIGETSKSSYLSPNGERVVGYRCDVCSLVFPDEHILSMHRQLIHVELSGDPSQSRTFKCHLCSKSFVMKGSLMVHMRVAHFGGAVVARLVEAKQLETNAVSPESAQYVCSICNKGFRKEQQLIQHEKLHDGKQCDICLKTFTTKYFLRKHKRLHTGEMPYTCHVCNKSFTFQQSYHKHLLYHSDEKPHTCPDCGRSFKELSTLHNHQRIHTGEKPFSCDTCGMLTHCVVLIQFASSKGNVFVRECRTWFTVAYIRG